jgi:sigma-B regulation protein RsbU (phosphoserine phosphatase)
MNRIHATAASQSLIGDYMTLFAATEIFIFVFMEIVTKIDTIQRVLFHEARRIDYIVFILVFGGFSIFGTYAGIPLESGAISNIRDLAPIVAGLTTGPVVGLAVGLIGGIHRYFLGGPSCVSCGLATVLAGLIAGGFYYLNKKRLVGILPGIGIAVFIELVHAGVTLLIVQPFDLALDIIYTAIPGMMIANGIGIAIAIVIIRNAHEIRELRERSK